MRLTSCGDGLSHVAGSRVCVAEVRHEYRYGAHTLLSSTEESDRIVEVLFLQGDPCTKHQTFERVVLAEDLCGNIPVLARECQARANDRRNSVSFGRTHPFPSLGSGPASQKNPNRRDDGGSVC